jgi:hypothetical protein
MKESFLTQFTNKASKAHQKSADCYKTQDYMGFLAGHFEEGYYRTLAFAVNGDDHEAHKNKNEEPVIDRFWGYFKIEKQGTSRVTQALKKMGKLDKIPEIEAAIKRLFTDAAEDFLALSNKSTYIYRTLMSMGSWERIENGLTNNVNNDVDPVDKLFMDDKVIMGIINRRKGKGYFDVFIKEIQGILQ